MSRALTWATHTAIAAALNVALIGLGFDPVGGAFFYYGREITDHQLNGTTDWVDRIMDVVGPTAVTALMLWLTR